MAAMVMSEFWHMTIIYVLHFFHCTLLMIAVQAKTMQRLDSKPFVIVSRGSTGKIQCPSMERKI